MKTSNIVKFATLGLGTTLAALTLTTSNPAMAGVIYDNGGPLNNFGTPSDFGTPQQVADNFSLITGQNTISDFHWWGFYQNNPGTFADAFTIRLFADSGSLPASIPSYTFNVGSNVTKAISGTQTNGNLVYSYSTNVTPTTIPAGNWWLSIVNNFPVTDNGEWNWSSTNTTGSAAFRTADGNSWNTLPVGDNAFNITNDGVPVPEPSLVFGLLAVGGLGLTTLRKRK